MDDTRGRGGGRGAGGGAKLRGDRTYGGLACSTTALRNWGGVKRGELRPAARQSRRRRVAKTTTLIESFF
jgi:hypothetical protein